MRKWETRAVTSSELPELLAHLVGIDSVNPSLVPGGAGEGAVADTVEAWARAKGLTTQRHEATPGRPSLLVSAPGSGGGKTLLLCGHLDTVGVDGMDAPFSARVDGDRLYGRGSYDMKGGLVAALLACRDAAQLGLAGDVVLAAVADEEHESLGVQECLEHVRPDAAVVTESTELGVAVAHKGFVWVDLEITGRAAHGSRPHLGTDAILKAGPVLTALGRLDADLEARTHTLVGRASLHASLIDGGAERSSYPACCRISVERRTLPGERAEAVEQEIGTLLDECRAADPELTVTQRTVLVRDGFEVDPGEPIVGAALEARGKREPVGVSYWADAAFFAAAGVPTVLLGPVGEGAHAAEEWVSVESCETLRIALVDIARRICA